MDRPTVPSPTRSAWRGQNGDQAPFRVVPIRPKVGDGWTVCAVSRNQRPDAPNTGESVDDGANPSEMRNRKIVSHDSSDVILNMVMDDASTNTYLFELCNQGLLVCPLKTCGWSWSVSFFCFNESTITSWSRSIFLTPCL